MTFAHQSKGYDDYVILILCNGYQRIKCSNGNFIHCDEHFGRQRRYSYQRFQGFQSYQNYQSYQYYQNFQGDMGYPDYQGGQSYQDNQGFQGNLGRQGYFIVFRFIWVVLALFIFDKVGRIFRVIQVLGVVSGITVVKVTILHSN